MRSKKPLLIILGVILAAGVGVTARVLHQDTESWHPFTAQLSEIWTDPAGNVQQHREVSAVIYSDGSTRRTYTNALKHTELFTRIENYRTLKEQVSDEQTASVSTYALKHAPTPQACKGDPTSIKILGYEVLKNTRSIVVPGSPRYTYTTAYMAPALNCAPLLVTQDTVRSDTGELTQHFTRSVESLKEGEPDEALLTFPAGKYTERAPSQVVLMRHQLAGKPCPDCAKKAAAVFDEIYKSRQ